jgi:hypothetical protein
MRIDNDTVQVIKATRSGTALAPTNIEIQLQWNDSNGNVMGTFTFSFADLDDIKRVIAEQDSGDIIRSLVTLLVDRNNGSFNPLVFNQMEGSTYRITTRATKI